MTLSMGTLYVVATPIGNLEDLTPRAVRILGEISLIAAEDTRSTRKLLTYYGIHCRLVSFHEANKVARIPRLLEQLESMDIALVSEAGVPGVSDPGRELVAQASERGISVVPVPGPSAVTAALSVSGLPAGRFHFLGFLPSRSAGRRAALQSAAGRETLVIFEAPHRLIACLKDMEEVLGDRRLTVCRELTKMYEEVFRGTVSEAAAHFEQPRGEFTLVVEGMPEVKPVPDISRAASELAELRSKGSRAREAVAQVAASSGLSRKQVYRLWLSLPAAQ